MGHDPLVPKATIPGGAARPLVLRLTTTEEARRAVELARAYGFTELWAETDRKEALVEAAKGGLPTRLFVRPWAIPGARADSDATVLGETGRAVAARQATDPLWSALATEMRQQGYPRLGPRLADGDLMSPFDPAWPARCNAIAALASTPGLAGVIVAEATPRGYEEKDQPAATGGYSRLLQEAWGFGYDERARLAFFGQAGYDPVDLTTEALDTDLELDTPTFPRYPKPPLALVREAYDLWTTFRAKASAAALSGLRDALGEVPVLAEVRRTYGWQPPLGDATLAPWARGEVPPAYDDQRVPALPGAMGLVSAPDPRMRDALAEFGTAMRVLAPLAKLPHAFDLTRVLSARWEEFVSQGLRRR